MCSYRSGRRSACAAAAIVCLSVGAAAAASLLIGGRNTASAEEARKFEIPVDSTPAPDTAPAPDSAPARAEPPRAAAGSLEIQGPRTLATTAGDAVHVVPPEALPGASDPRAPIVMVLHGMCMDPAAMCDAFGAAAEGGFLVCPAGNASCGGGADWSGSGGVKAAFLDASLTALGRAYAGRVEGAGADVLVGFSRGAFVARDVIYERPGRWRGAVFMGAAFSPDVERFRAAGIRRVIFASGDYDGARATMKRAAAMLDARGLPARFVSLGPIPHALPAFLDPFLRASLAWVREGAPSDAPALPASRAGDG